jgi:hypothetical protein
MRFKLEPQDTEKERLKWEFRKTTADERALYAARIIEGLKEAEALFKQRLNTDWHFRRSQQREAFKVRQRHSAQLRDSLESGEFFSNEGVRGQRLFPQGRDERASVSGNVETVCHGNSDTIKGVDPWPEKIMTTAAA